jgi:hypothetical protein
VDLSQDDRREWEFAGIVLNNDGRQALLCRVVRRNMEVTSPGISS